LRSGPSPTMSETVPRKIVRLLNRWGIETARDLPPGVSHSNHNSSRDPAWLGPANPLTPIPDAKLLCPTIPELTPNVAVLRILNAASDVPLAVIIIFDLETRVR